MSLKQKEQNLIHTKEKIKSYTYAESAKFEFESSL